MPDSHPDESGAKRRFELSEEAYRLICGLAATSAEMDAWGDEWDEDGRIGPISESDHAWDEVRANFPVSDYRHPTYDGE